MRASGSNEFRMGAAMSSDNGHDSSKAARMVNETIEEAKQVRKLCYEQLYRFGSLDDEVHMKLASIVVEYHRTLWVYRNSDAVDKDDYPNITLLENAMGRHTERIVTSSGRWGDSVQTETEPMVLSFPPGQLLAVVEDLNDLAVKLGFGAEISSSTRRVEITDELMEEVEKWQQMNLK